MRPAVRALLGDALIIAAAQEVSPMLTISESAIEAMYDLLVEELRDQASVEMEGTMALAHNFTPSPQLIRSQRLARGWTQAHLAELSGTSQQTIDRMERGQTKYSRALPAVMAALAS